MAAPPEAERSLESLINKATNPQNKDTDWSHIKCFYEQLNDEPDGPQLATRLLAHKIQSPQEWEAMQALMVLETCMKNCGKRFHLEVGKFRFLNELIKVVSPKYLGSRAPEPVKNKVLEMMYSWSVGLPEETKIADAYLMLKKQGIVQQDPVLPDDRPLPPPPPRTNALFEDEEKSKTLSRLLTSADADDLKAANKLIKEMVQEDQQRTEKVSKRLNTIQEVKESVGLLNQLLGAYSAPGGHSREHISHSNQELIKDLYQRCEKMRPTLFRLASDTEDNDEALADILQANDHLTQVINLYRHLVKGEDVNGDATATPSIPGSSGTSLLDLAGLDTATPTAAASSNQGKASIRNPSKDTTGLNLLDDELMSLGLSETTQSSNAQLGDWNTFQSSDSVDTAGPDVSAAALLPTLALIKPQAPSAGGAAAAPPKTLLDELDVLGKTLLQQSLPPQHRHVKWDKLQPASRVSLRDLQTQSNAGCGSPASRTSSRTLGSIPGLAPFEDALSDHRMSLADVTVPLESIKPSRMLPVTVVDKLSLRVLFHWASCPPDRPDVLVVIISMLSSAPRPLTNIRFQAAVPKVMRVKLQPPSGSDLPAFNPVLPPTAITQILLLANPHKDKVRLRYKLTFNLGNEAHDESGDVEQFPPPDTWGTL